MRSIVAASGSELLSAPIYVPFQDVWGGSFVRLHDPRTLAALSRFAGSLHPGLQLVLYDLDGRTPEEDLLTVGVVARGKVGEWIAELDPDSLIHVEDLDPAAQTLYKDARQRQEAGR